MKILVVEDSPTARSFIKSTLVSLGHREISEPEDGVAALRVVKSQQIDFVVPTEICQI